MKYPEHEKLKKVSEQSQSIGEFLEWAFSEKSLFFAEYVDGSDFPREHRQGIESILSEYFKIDQKKLEKEKREMLASIRG